MKRPLLFLSLLFFSATAFGANKLPGWAVPLAEIDCSHHDTNKIDAVCLLDRTELTIDPAGKLVSHSRQGYRILTTAGTSLGTLVLPYNSRGKIHKIKAWVRYPHGKTKGIKEGDTLDTQYLDSTFYTDARKRVIPLPGVTKGSVVFFEYELETGEEFMLEGWGFQSTIPILKSELSFDLPAGVDLSWRAINMKDGYQPQVSGKHYVFSRRDIPELPDEKMAPAASDLVEQVLLRFHSPSGGTPACETWADVARWYYGLTRDKWSIPPEVKSLSAELCQGAADQDEKMNRLCSWVQSKIRYVDIEIGMGGYIPHDQASVCETKYGDCKDKSFLLMGLLRSQGIESWPVLCRAGNRGNIVQEFPWPAVFNHCIIAIDAGAPEVRFFDPTSELVAFPGLPPSLEGAMGLVVREDSGELLPMTSGIEPRLDVRVEAEISASGLLSATVREVYGQAALRGVRARYRSLSDTERHKQWEEWLAQRIPGVKLGDVTWTNLYDADKDLIIEYELKAPGLVKRMGGLTMVSPFFIQDVSKPAFGKAKRELPVALEGSAIIARQEIVLKYPAGLVIEENIEPCDLNTDFGSFTTSSVEGEGELTLVKEYSVRNTTVLAVRYPEVKSFFAAVNNMERTEILFISSE